MAVPYGRKRQFSGDRVIKRQTRRWQSRLGTIAAMMIALFLVLGVQVLAVQPSPTFSSPRPSPVTSPTSPLSLPQVPQLEQLDRLLQSTTAREPLRQSEVATRRVQLDGYTLFLIAAPRLLNDTTTTGTTPPAAQPVTQPVEQRVENIERRLDRTASSPFDPATLAVNATLDEASNLPIITISTQEDGRTNEQYLMTVTTLDAQIQGTTPERWADELTQIIRAALVRAQRERTPSFLVRQGAIAISITVVTLFISWILTRVQRRCRLKQDQLMAQNQSLQHQAVAQNSGVPESGAPDSVMPDSAKAIVSSQSPSMAGSSTTALQVQHPLAYQRSIDQCRMQRRLLQVVQLGIWSANLFLILGLFPQTRWLRPLLFSTPLKLLSVLVGIYVLVRVTDLLIDRFFAAVEESQFLTTDLSQRAALRVSTLSQVLKSVAAIAWITAGILFILSFLGVDVVPLLAGAGILGLAASFAAQSVIRDVINGFLILLEDQYAVGDVISIDHDNKISGFVETINLRITQLRDTEGRLITIPNSQINIVQNLTKDWARVDILISFADGTHPDRALELLQTVAQEMYNDAYWQTKLLATPEVLGVEAMDYTGLTIRVWIKTRPLQQWIVAREFRRRVKLKMLAEGITVGIPQQSLQVHELPDPSDVEKV